MVKEKKTGKMFAMKCVKRKQKKDLNLENEINVLRRLVLPSAGTAETLWSTFFLFPAVYVQNE